MWNEEYKWNMGPLNSNLGERCLNSNFKKEWVLCVDRGTREAKVTRPCLFGFFSFWPPKAAANCQTSQFLARFYKNCFGKNCPKSTWTQNRSSRHDSRNTSLSRFWTLWTTPSSSIWNPHDTQILSIARFSKKLARKKLNQIGQGWWMESGDTDKRTNMWRGSCHRCGWRLLGHVSRMWETCIWYTTCEDFDGWASRLSITIIRRFRRVWTAKLGSKVQRESEVTHDVIMKGTSRQINLVKIVWQSDQSFNSWFILPLGEWISYMYLAIVLEEGITLYKYEGVQTI
jgi:hypothetical protein